MWEHAALCGFRSADIRNDRDADMRTLLLGVCACLCSAHMALEAGAAALGQLHADTAVRARLQTAREIVEVRALSVRRHSVPWTYAGCSSASESRAFEHQRVKSPPAGSGIFHFRSMHVCFCEGRVAAVSAYRRTCGDASDTGVPETCAPVVPTDSSCVTIARCACTRTGTARLGSPCW